MLARLGLGDKVAVVVGGGGPGGKGMGPSICSLLAEAGANVVVVDIKADRAELVAGEIRSKGQKALAVAADIRDTQQIANVVQTSLTEFGHIDVLVNIVGRGWFLPALQTDETLWDKHMDINLKYIWLCCKAVAATMIEQRRKGSIVNVASISGISAAADHAAYGAAKGGLISLTKSLAVEWGPHHIRVNSIAPGHTGTPDALQFWAKHPGVMERMKESTPLGRVGTPDDMAGAMLWLASDLADYVTGQTIIVDGGFLLNPIWKLGLTM